jgi:hypothetical protein
MTKTIRSLNGISKVVGSSLFYDYDNKTYHLTYHLVHYDTEILTIKYPIKYHSADIRSYEIVKALKCSNSSTRAIYQVTDFLEIPREIVKKSMVPFSNFASYKTGEVRKKKSELFGVIEQ